MGKYAHGITGFFRGEKQQLQLASDAVLVHPCHVSSNNFTTAATDSGGN